MRTEGIDVSDQRPRRVTAEELAAASCIISMGCDLSDVDLFSIAIGVIAFLVIVLLKVDVALVAVAAMVGGIAYPAMLALAGRG